MTNRLRQRRQPCRSRLSPSTPAGRADIQYSGRRDDLRQVYPRRRRAVHPGSGESAIQDYNKKIYSRTGSHIAILTTDGTGGKTLESCTNSAFDSMGLSEYDMLFAIDTSTEQWYVTTGSYVADYTDSKLESIFQDGFAAILTATRTTRRTRCTRICTAGAKPA
ncbi:MAG: TPM domain-containing protein [Acutalibacteraceae bacterium]